MKDKSFIDTNVFIYAFADNSAKKTGRALALVDHVIPFVSTQVLREFFNVGFKKLGAASRDLIDQVNVISERCVVVAENIEILTFAAKLKEKYGFSYYDCLIIASALTANCKYLYSEDMQDGQMVEDKLRIVNPFT